MAISYNRSEFSHRGKKFNQMQTKNALKAAVWYLQEYSYYAPIMERFPIRSDEELSKMDRDDLIQHETCACANGNNVNIDTELMVNLINEDIDLCSKNHGVSDNLMDCVQTIVAHEYNHILCQHHKIAGKIYDTYKGNVPKVVYYAHVYAAEIEANRGHCVNEDSAVYKCGVTDENYPEVKPLRYYSQLFEHFLRMGKEQQQKFAEMMKKFAKQLATSAKSSGNNELGSRLKKRSILSPLDKERGVGAMEKKKMDRARARVLDKRIKREWDNLLDRETEAMIPLNLVKKMGKRELTATEMDKEMKIAKKTESGKNSPKNRYSRPLTMPRPRPLH